MGNKVISAGTKKQTVANKKEVYVDLDMGSAPVYPKMPSIDYDAYYATLAQEKMTP